MELSKEVTQDSKNIASLLWIGTVFLVFIPGLIFYIIKKDDSYIQDQAKEALNWSITAIICYLCFSILIFILLGILLIQILTVCHIVLCIMGAINTSNGKIFRVPFPIIRLVK